MGLIKGEDDGTTWGGVMATICCILCLILGYKIRDWGFVINVNNEQQQEYTQP